MGLMFFSGQYERSPGRILKFKLTEWARNIYPVRPGTQIEEAIEVSRVPTHVGNTEEFYLGLFDIIFLLIFSHLDTCKVLYGVLISLIFRNKPWQPPGSPDCVLKSNRAVLNEVRWARILDLICCQNLYERKLESWKK